MVVEAHLHQRTCDKSLTGSVSGTHAHEICCTLLGGVSPLSGPDAVQVLHPVLQSSSITCHG